MGEMRRGSSERGRTQTTVANGYQGLALFCAQMFFVIFASVRPAQAQSMPVTAGYRDFNFGTTSSSEPTYGKSESKLWWNDGLWWGILWNPSTNRYEIYRFDLATQSWTTTNTAVDTRSGSRADALWDGQRLYVVSHFYTTSPGPTISAYFSRLYRYSYNAAAKLYSVEAGFPVNVNSSKCETLTLDKDSTGRLWITWVENSKVMVNRTMGNDLTWGAPFILPVQGNDTDPDDISTLVAFGGNKIGVMWSNQKDSTNYFAVHLDSDADNVWQNHEIALSGAGIGPISKDHFNLKASRDGSGNLYAAALTNLSGSKSTGIFVLKRSAAGAWTRHVFATVGLNHNRPMLVVDDENQRLYVFAKSTETGPGIIYMKSASLNDLVFPTGLGTPVIQSAADTSITNPTSTKQCINGASGILVLAGDKNSRNYLHNYIDLINGVPQITSFVPVSGAIGTQVTMTGSNFSGVTSVAFNGTPAASFTIDSNTQLRATVAAGTTTGKISVLNAVGPGSSATNFVVTKPPTISSFSPVRGLAGAVVTITGSKFAGAMAVSFNGTPTTFTLNSSTQIHANVPAGATTGPISVTNSAGTGASASSFIAQHTLTLAYTGSGSVALNPPGSEALAGAAYDEGTVVTLTATPAAGWEFNDWGADLQGTTSTTTLTMNADKQVKAVFKAITHFTVTVTVVGAGSVTLDPPGGVYYRDTVVKLIATPTSGYVFSGYSGDFKGWMNVETMTIDANKNLTATFSPLPAPRYPKIWTSATEISKLPTAGLSWDNLKAGADKPIGPPNLSDSEDSVNVAVLAKALVYARTGDESYRQAVIAACMAAIGTEQNGETLYLGRELMAYVLAADLVGLPPTEDATFRNWLRKVLTENLQGQTLRSSHETRPNNWGTHCGATRAAIARYLGDATELERTARIFKGWLGDRNTYADFSFDHDLSWQADPNAPVGINPLGATIQGHSVDGVLPDDQRRAGPFVWPPPKENYVYGALQGALMQAIILYRAGYSVWSWENQALRRALKWLYNQANYPADGDDEWIPYIIKRFYKAAFSAPFPASPGKNAGWTDWLYGSKYALTVSDNNGDIAIKSLGAVNDSLAVMLLTAIPDADYLFNGWSGDLSGVKNPDTLLMSSNKSVIANFVKTGPFTVTVTPVGSGTVTLNPPGGTYYGGTVVTLTATPNSGFVFKGWSGDLAGTTNPAQLMITVNKNITATFKAVYTLSVEVVSSGTVTLNPPGGTYEVGTVVTLTATPAAGYQFVEWSGDLSGSINPATITMSANKHVTATFAAIGVVHQETQTGGSSSSTTVTTAASLTGVSSQLYLAAISTKPKVKVNAVSGLGLTWTLVRAQCSGRNNIGVEVWMAQGMPSGIGTVTATLASAPSNAVIAVSRYSGTAITSPVGNVISGNTQGLNGTCSGGVDNSAYSFNLITTVNGAFVYGVAAMRNKTHMPGAGYTERTEFKQASTSGSAAALAVEDKVIPAASTATVNGSFSDSSDWAVVAVEIKPPAGAVSPDKFFEGEKKVTGSVRPVDFQLLNYPNPFNAQTSIEYLLPETAKVSVFIYNINGQKVRTLVEATQLAEQQRLQWDGRDDLGREVGSGVYLIRLEAGMQRLTKRIIFLK